MERYDTSVEKLGLEIKLPSELFMNEMIRLGIPPTERKYIVELSIPREEYVNRLSQIIDKQNIPSLRELCVNHLDVYDSSYRDIIKNTDDALLEQVLHWLKEERAEAERQWKELDADELW